MATIKGGIAPDRHPGATSWPVGAAVALSVSNCSVQILVSTGASACVARWNASGAGFDLIKATNTYELWLGSNFFAYPHLWPQRVDTGGDSSKAGWEPGLILGLLVWGMVLVILDDLLEFFTHSQLAFHNLAGRVSG